MRVARAAFVIVASCWCFGLSTSASATNYKGDVQYWGAFNLTIIGDHVSSLRGHSGRIPCSGDGDLDPVDFRLTSPVPVVNGSFTAAGTTKSGYNTPLEWSLKASVSIARTVAGTVTISGKSPHGDRQCSGTFRVAAIIPPRYTRPRVNTTYTGTQVNFDYKRGVVSTLTAFASTTCPGGGSMGAKLHSTAYRLDPIQVNSGRFHVEADILDDYGVVTHVLVKGKISGKSASGTVTSSRGWDLNGKLLRCTGRYAWKASVPAGPAPAISSSGAFYDITPYRYGVPGAWTYYLMVRPNACTGGVTAVRFTVAGAARTVPCNTSVRLGPLNPKRTYRVHVVAIRTRNGSTLGTQLLADANVYIPGDDGHWVRTG
jgi:hypothetical protein